MELFPVTDDLVLAENAAYLVKEKTLVISDLQLGMEGQLRAMGHDVLYEQAAMMLGLLEVLIEQTGAKRLVIDGDLKHEFGRISAQERKDILGLLSLLKRRIEIVVVKGNHDTMTKPLTDELGVPLLSSWSAGGFYAVHGHVLPDENDSAFKNAHTIIIGHMHPAITLTDGVRKERCKCFLVGKYGKKRLVVLPSFSTIVEGSDVLTVGPNSPLVKDVEKCEVYVVSDEMRPFGMVERLRGKLY